MNAFELDLREEVQRDIDQAVAFYAPRSPRAASRFLQALDFAYARILENPTQFPIVHKDVRRVFLLSFPYGVYYVVLDGRIDVVAVMNLHQHPDTWRLSDR